jgi:adenosylhomocysteinase
MDMSFANQALAAEHLLKSKGTLQRRVYGVPLDIDREIARLWLETHNLQIDNLTDEQVRYLGSWK